MWLPSCYWRLTASGNGARVPGCLAKDWESNAFGPILLLARPRLDKRLRSGVPIKPSCRLVVIASNNNCIACNLLLMLVTILKSEEFDMVLLAYVLIAPS